MSEIVNSILQSEFTSIDRYLRKTKRKSVSLLQSCLKAGLLQPLKID